MCDLSLINSKAVSGKGYFYIKSLMKSDIIHDSTFDILKNIDVGNINISDFYVDLVKKMHLFIEELVKFSYKISKCFL